MIAPLELVALLEPDECARIIARTRESTAWREATVTYGERATVIPGVRDARVLDEAAWPPSLAAFAAKVRAGAEALDAARTRVLRAGEIQLVRYPPGGFFMLHHDAGPDPKEWRKISVVVYLNDDFGGGETRFPSLNAAVRARTGYALTFPAQLAHEGAPVTGAEKYILSFWLGS